MYTQHTHCTLLKHTVHENDDTVKNAVQLQLTNGCFNSVLLVNAVRTSDNDYKLSTM